MREEWIQTTLGDVAVLEYGKALKEADRDGDGFPVFGSAGVVGWHSVPLVADGPVIIVGRKGTAGAVHWSPGPCSVIDTAYWVRITEAQLRTDFAHLVISSLSLPSLSAQTGVPGLNRDRAYSQPLSVPTVPEQRRIVDLVGSIDRYIDSLQTQVEATRAARSALLAESLSRPAEGWRTSTLGQVADVVSGGTPKSGEPAFWNGDVMWVTPTEVVANNGRTVFSTDRMITEAGLNSCSAKLLPVDTVLLTSRATIGAVALAGVPLATNQGFASLVCGKEVLPKFVMYWCQANKQKFVARAGGNTFLEISRKKVASTPIDVPPLTEQRRIVDLVESVDEQIVSLGIQIDAAQTLRIGVLSELLSGERLLDESYDMAVSL